MPIPAAPLRRGDRGTAVAQLHRTLEAIGRTIDQAERDARIFGPATEAVLSELQTQSAIKVTGVFDADTYTLVSSLLADIGPFSVFGTLTDADGNPIAGAAIVAVDVDLRSTEVLGGRRRWATDSGGEYEVRYAPSQFARAEKASADVRVTARIGREVVAESAVTFNAPTELEINLTAAQRYGLSEVERLEIELPPILAGGPLELTEADVDFLAGETGLSADAWRGYVRARRLLAEVPDGIPLAACHGWQRTGQPETWEALRAVRVGVLRSALLDALDRNLIPRTLRNDLEAILARIPNVEQGGLTGLLEAAAVPADVTRGVVGRIDGIDAVSDRVLAELIDAQAVTREDAGRIGLAASVHRLAGGEPAVAAALMRAEFPAVPGGRLREARDLAVLEPRDWAVAMEAAGAPVPAGTTREAHARTRAIAATRAFPEEAFRHRAARTPQGLAQQVERFQLLLGANKNALDRDFDDLDLSGVPARQRAAVREAHEELRALANAHPSLGLREVFATGGREAAAIAATRTGWVADVLARNPETRFSELDYLPDTPALTAIDFGDVPPESRAQVLADLRIQRRVSAVAGDAVTAQELMRAGFHSGSAIARTSTPELLARTGIPQAEMQRIQINALSAANEAALAWFGIYDMTRDRATTPVRVIPTREQFFYPLRGYASLINDEAWCECEQCQSVLSPAAYFVDLMYYVDTYVLADSFAAQPAHPLHLARRRPDLWELPLSCANTKNIIPTLDIVNELLERYIRETVPLAAGTAVYAHLAEQQASFRQPFTLPIEQLDTLLGHFKLSRHAVARSMRAPRAVQARARLGLSTRAYGLITTERVDPAYLEPLFGIETTVTAPDTAIPDVPMETIVRTTGLDHADLKAALESDFVRGGETVPGAIAVVIGKRFPNDVQNNTEVVTNLTFRRLDRLHRFLRLWRRLPWTVIELDYVLGRFAAANTPAAIVADTTTTPGTLERILQLLELEAAWSIPLEQILAITDAFPTRVLRATPALFDRLFNNPGFAHRDGAWTPQTAGRFTHAAWSAAGVASPADNTLARLLAGLQLENQDFLTLVDGIRSDPALDYRPAGQGTSASISLARASIASLYRHARVRSLLRLPIEDFVALLGVVPRGAGPAPLRFLGNADDVRTLAEFVGWREKAGLAVRDVVYLGGGARPPGVPDPQAVTRDLAATAAAAADAATRASMLAGGGALSLFDLAIGAELGRAPEEMALLRACVAAPSANDLAAIRRVLDGGTVSADLDIVSSLVSAIVRFHRLLPRPAFDRDGLTFLRQQRAAFFGAAPAAGAAESITIDAIRRIQTYRRLATPADAGFTTAGPAPDLAAIQAVLSGGQAGTNAQLARALGADEAGVAALTPHLATTGQPFADLMVLSENLDLARQLGVSGETLARMIDESNPAATFDQLSRAADDVLGAFRARYPDPQTLTAKLEPYEDILRGGRRDGLVEYLTTRWPTPFSSPDRLSEYFLIDVMVEGCARTSRVVSATSSVQLYVHRVLMNLERSADWDPAAKPPKGVWARFTPAAKRDEWQWRQYYRVWEANRKLFLYPENYIEPELRDDKTPLFRELEDTLLMQDLTPQNINDAYSSYLTGFDGLAQLQIAGAYRDVDGRTLHLFGVTQDDAPVYYYRAIDESRSTAAHPAPLYSAWHRIDLAIPVRKVSPFLFEGRLYLFWIENATRPFNAFIGGSSQFNGYRHTVRLRYSTLRLDGTWAAPQLVRFAEQGGVADARIVEDPRDTRIVDEMKARLASLNNMRPVLVNEVSAKRTNRNQVRDNILPNAVAATNNARDTLYAPITFEQGLEMAGLIAIGVPPDKAWWIVKAIAKAVYQSALNTENGIRELVRNLDDILANAETRLGNLDREIADLNAAIAAQVIHVRWDRSLRDHTESLDSYHPDGWVWDRVYPDVYTPPRPDLPANAPRPQALRLTLVPAGNRLPTEVPYSPGDLDAVSGILREPLVTEQPSWRTDTNLNFEAGRIQQVTQTARGYAGQNSIIAAQELEVRGTAGSDVANAPAAADVQVVMGQAGSIVVQHAGDSVWLRAVGTGYSGLRLGTSLTRLLARQFWSGGPTGLLDSGFQGSLIETRSRISPIAGQSDPLRQSPFHPEHPWLVYYREVFLHTPFLIADHLNTDQDFAGAQRMYHTMFDPTAADGNAWRNRELAEPDNQSTTLRDLLIDSASLDAYRTNPFSPHAIARTRMSAYAKAIVMKYIDNLLDWGDSLFAQFTMESVNEATMLYVMARDILGPRPAMLGSCGTGAETRTYREIRAGLSKVSDFLVELETPRALTPSQTAAGRNVFVVPSQTEQPVLFTQAAIALPAAPRVIVRGGVAADVNFPGVPQPPDPSMGAALGFGGPTVAQTPAVLAQHATSHTVWTSTGGRGLTTLSLGGGNVVPGVGTDTPVVIPGSGVTDYVRGYGPGSVGTRFGNALDPFTELAGKYGLEPLDVKYELGDVPVKFDHRHDGHQFEHYHFDPVDVVPPKDTVFCIPANKELLGYWDRVDDRLRKIRNCMDISGASRRLELFAPEIDPRLLVRMTAAGLTIDDILGLAAAQPPVYRFSYLIEKAKQEAGTVQSFGGQLLGALEKGDAEELNHLRSVHEQNLLTMRRKLAQLEIASAEDSLASLRSQREAVEYRRQHFAALRETGTLPQEFKQQELQREASQFRSAAGIAQTVASILTVIPDFGAPTAMKFGGSQLGAAGRAVGEGLGARASYFDTGGVMAGIEGSVRRRDDEWLHQEEAARRELTQLDQGITAAEIRRDIAVRSLEVHERTIEQSEEMFAFFRERFATVDRYRLIAKDLRRLYKIAFDSALRLAQLAEQAYRAERQDDNPSNDDDVLAGGYWDPQNGGLLAGEKLLADLQRLERQYLVRNKRKLEIEHSFSLAQFAPDKLAQLRLTGECAFSIPEWFFDLSYPGQYRRRLRAVRITMPCVTGPYTNVGATLRLTGSSIRSTAPTNQADPLAPLTAVALGQTVAIATSKGQQDGGVFEFSFRDDRYMPFEGAGAISDWSLTLPKTVRMFDYDTISDVIVHLDYTADYHAELARRWDVAAQLVTLLTGDVGGQPPFVRRFSLRDEMPDVFYLLTTSAPGTDVPLVFDSRHFSLFLAGRQLDAQSASITIVTPLEDLAGATIALARRPQPPSAAAYISATAPNLPTGGVAGLREFNCGSVLSAAPANAGLTPDIIGAYLIKIASAGALAAPAAANTIAAGSLRDIVLRVGYRLAATGN